jgi:hypothetical protein
LKAFFRSRLYAGFWLFTLQGALAAACWAFLGLARKYVEPCL